MIIQTLIVGLIVYQRNSWKYFILPSVNIRIILVLVMLKILMKSLILLQITWLVTIEEIFFRGVLIDRLENTTRTNMINGLIYGLYEMIYSPSFETLIASTLFGYLLAVCSRKFTIYELIVGRTFIYSLSSHI
jgi:hypothetical protein